MNKKIAAIAGSGMLVLAMAVPAFASTSHRHHIETSLRNYADVETEVISSASTGGNNQNNSGSGDVDQGISTGNARATADSLVLVNGLVGDPTMPDTVVNHADVDTTVAAMADSGLNRQRNTSSSVRVRSHHGHHSSTPSVDQWISTGNATADSLSTVLVNVSMPSLL